MAIYVASRKKAAGWCCFILVERESTKLALGSWVLTSCQDQIFWGKWPVLLQRRRHQVSVSGFGTQFLGSGFTTSGPHGAVYHLSTPLTCKQRIKHTYDCIFTCLQLHQKLARRRHPLHVWNLRCGVSSNTYKTKKKAQIPSQNPPPLTSPKSFQPLIFHFHFPFPDV